MKPPQQDRFRVQSGIPIEPECILRLYMRNWPLDIIARTLKITPAKAAAMIDVAKRKYAN